MSDGLLGAYRKVLGSGLSTAEKLVLIAILDHWSANAPQPYPSAERLGALASLNPRSVRRVIRSLVNKAATHVLATPGRPNRYDLTAAFEGRLPEPSATPNPGHTVTPDGLSPLTESAGDLGPSVTPPLTYGPRTPDRMPPEGASEGTHRRNPLKEPGARKRGGTRGWRFVPPSWQPSEQHRQLAKELGVDFNRELATFRDHEWKVPKTDASRAFGNWLRKAQPSGGNGKSGKRGGPAPVSSDAEFAAMADDFGGLT